MLPLSRQVVIGILIGCTLAFADDQPTPTSQLIKSATQPGYVKAKAAATSPARSEWYWQGSAATHPATTQASLRLDYSTTTQATTTQAAAAMAATTQSATSPSTTWSATTQASTSPSTTQSTTSPTTQTSATPASTRYFAWLLDTRSRYGKNWFPQPFIGPSFDANNQMAFKYSHSEDASMINDSGSFTLEHAYKFLTVGLNLDYIRSHSDGSTTSGLGPVSVTVRHPLYEYVSWDDKVDFTLGGRVLVAFASNSDVSKDGAVREDLWTMTRFGEHWSVQTNIGLQTFIGPTEGGTLVVPYDIAAGYRLSHDELPIPHISETIPMVELNGVWSMEDNSHALLGAAGVWLDFDQHGNVQPKLGFGITLPIDDGARRSQDWGAFVNLLISY